MTKNLEDMLSDKIEKALENSIRPTSNAGEHKLNPGLGKQISHMLWPSSQ